MNAAFDGPFGGPVALPLVLDAPARLTRLALLSTWCWPLAVDPAFAARRRALRSGLVRWLYRRFDFSARVLVRQAWGRRVPLTRAEHRTYMAQFPDAASREGPRGALDRFVGPAHHERWRARLPGGRFVELPEVGHFAPAEAPEDVTLLLKELL